MQFLDADIGLYVGYCLGSFGVGFGIAFIFKAFKQLGEKI